MIGGSRFGVELSPSHVRVVRAGTLGTGVPRTFELAWDPTRPREAVDTLQETLGSASSLALSVGLGFLQVKHLELPPLPAAERARMLALEPERYFANHEAALVVALVGGADLAFAASDDLVSGWLAAFEEWAPVSRVEPAPVSVARALGREANGVFQLEAAPDEAGSIEVRNGALRAARRMRVTMADSNAPPLPAVSGVPGPFLAALGALRGTDEPLEAVLVSPDTASRLASRRRRNLVLSSAMVAATLVFALWAADGWRERTLRGLEEQVSTEESRSSAANAALQSLLVLETEAQTIQRLAAQRPDPFSALAAIGGALPHDVVVLSAKASGDDWQLDGTARDASALVPMLDKDDRFDSVHFLSASSRYNEGRRSYETFSVALRYRPRP